MAVSGDRRTVLDVDHTDGRTHTGARVTDRGFTLVEVVIAIVLVGILSAVVVIGVGNLTTRGSGAACAASADAARVAATTRLATTGTAPTTFTDLTSDGTLQLPTGTTIDPNGRRLVTSSWELVLTPGAAGTPPTFTCTGTTSALALTDLGTTGADAVYSLRRVSIDHTGPVVRVRRSTDNTETDIGTTTTGDLDESALLSFTGTASAFVTTWYDQSGAGRHATQTTPAAQPRIVNAGAIDREGTRPTLVFSGAQFLTMPTTVIVTGNNPSTINTVARRTMGISPSSGRWL